MNLPVTDDTLFLSFVDTAKPIRDVYLLNIEPRKLKPEWPIHRYGLNKEAYRRDLRIDAQHLKFLKPIEGSGIVTLCVPLCEAEPGDRGTVALVLFVKDLLSSYDYNRKAFGEPHPEMVSEFSCLLPLNEYLDIPGSALHSLTSIHLPGTDLLVWAAAVALPEGAHEDGVAILSSFPAWQPKPTPETDSNWAEGTDPASWQEPSPIRRESRINHGFSKIESDDTPPF